MQDDPMLFELEDKLIEAKEKYDGSYWKECLSFPKYRVDIYGHVKNPAHVERRRCPRNRHRKANYFVKEKILKHLHSGLDQKWTTVRIKDKNDKLIQVSVAKLMVSSFLEIEIDKLPRQIYFIDCDTKNLSLANLTFIRSKKERDKLYSLSRPKLYL
jgi:hypothetical protein